MSVRHTAVWINTDKCQIRCGASVSAAKMKGGHVLWIVERNQAVAACQSNKVLSIGTAVSITPVDMWTIKIAGIENRAVKEHWEIRRLQSRWWALVGIGRL